MQTPINYKNLALEVLSKKATDQQLDRYVREVNNLPPRPDGVEPLKSLFGYIEAVEGSKAAAESTRPVVFDLSKLDWNDFNSKVSRYFTVGEVMQYDKRRMPQSTEIKNNVLWMAQQLDRVREAWGSSIGVTSWYRDPATNSRVGGAIYSQHLNGWGVDIYPHDGSIYDFQKWLDSKWGDALGYGAARGFVHVDGRSRIGFNGKPGSVRWAY